MLTTEQKINLLILAGYESKQYVGTSTGAIQARLFGRGLVLMGRDGREDLEWEIDSEYTRAPIENYTPLAWELAGLDGCPDELIYKAIGADDET